MPPARSLRLAAAGTLVALTLTACSGTRSAEEPAAAAEPTTVTVQDNHGPQTVPSPARSVVATDNSTFETLDAWDVPLTAAPRALMPATVSYKTDDSVVDLAHRLGLRVIAEGVEDTTMLHALHALGCDETQGYLHARPMTAEGFDDWLATAGGSTTRSTGTAPVAVPRSTAGL